MRRRRSVDESMNLVRRLFPFRTCTIDIKDGERALPRPCLLYHIKRCQGPCIEAVSKADYRRPDRPDRAVPRGPPGVGRPRRSRPRCGRRPSGPTTSGRRSSATRSGRSSGRWRARRWRPSRRTELDLVGLARQDNQAAIQLFAIRDGKMIGRDVFLLDAAHEAPDEEVLSSFLEQFYARATSIPPQVLVPLPAAGRGRPRGVPRRAGAAGRSTWPSRSAARSAS